MPYIMGHHYLTSSLIFALYYGTSLFGKFTEPGYQLNKRIQ